MNEVFEFVALLALAFSWLWIPVLIGGAIVAHEEWRDRREHRRIARAVDYVRIYDLECELDVAPYEREAELRLRAWQASQ